LKSCCDDRGVRDGIFSGSVEALRRGTACGNALVPRAGLTLALDFAMRGEPTLRLMKALDRVVLELRRGALPARMRA